MDGHGLRVKGYNANSLGWELRGGLFAITACQCQQSDSRYQKTA